VRRVLSAVLSAAQRGAQAIGHQIGRLINADTALWIGWAMSTVGFALVDVPVGLIVGGASLAAGAFFVARGDEDE
jgi:hypothetical protein